MQDVIVKPIITEKSIQDAATGKFTFMVHKQADKRNIKKGVEEAFNVHVLSVATILVKGRTKRVGKKRTEKKDSPWKKAIVKLEKNEKIDLFDIGGAKE